MILLALATQAADGLTLAAFALLYPGLVLYAEQNPIICAVYGMTGLAGVLFLKAALPLSAAFLARKSHEWWIRPGFALIALSGALGTSCNVVALWSLRG